MYKLFAFIILYSLTSSCVTKDNYDKKLADSIAEIHIQNRAIDNFGGINEYRIKDKKEITSIYKELFSLKEKDNLPTKPYKGTIVIEFMRKDKYGTKEYINIFSTRIILKPNRKYFITNSKGQYISDHFLSRILNYVNIDKNKVLADHVQKTDL